MAVWSPRITSPTAGTVWKAGSKQEVKWDTSDAPVRISNGSMVVLAKDNLLDSERPLAKDFDLRAGCVTVTVPGDACGTDYSVILFGDSGNNSPTFTIENSA